MQIVPYKQSVDIIQNCVFEPSSGWPRSTNAGSGLEGGTPTTLPRSFGAMFWTPVNKLAGKGKTMVWLFSSATPWSACKYRSWMDAGCWDRMSAASLTRLAAFISPSAEMTCNTEWQNKSVGQKHLHLKITWWTKDPSLNIQVPIPQNTNVARNTMFQILLVIGTICAFEQTIIVVLLQNEKQSSICIKIICQKFTSVMNTRAW